MLLAVVRGTDNAAYYRSVPSAGGWTSIGGRLNSGLVATIDGQTGTAYVYALKTDDQVYQKPQPGGKPSRLLAHVEEGDRLTAES